MALFSFEGVFTYTSILTSQVEKEGNTFIAILFSSLISFSLLEMPFTSQSESKCFEYYTRIMII